jgi:hypothetical protein
VRSMPSLDWTAVANPSGRLPLLASSWLVINLIIFGGGSPLSFFMDCYDDDEWRPSKYIRTEINNINIPR